MIAVPDFIEFPSGPDLIVCVLLVVIGAISLMALTEGIWEWPEFSGKEKG